MADLIQADPLRKVPLHKSAGFFNLLSALRDTLHKRLSVILYQAGQQKQQIFFFPQITAAAHDHVVKRAQTADHFLIPDHILRKSRKRTLSRHFLCQIKHDLLADIEPPIIQRAAVRLHTGMVLSRMEQDHHPPSDPVLPVPAGQAALPALHKADHIVLMKMIGKGLHDPFKTIGFHPQRLVIDNGPDLFLHVNSSLSELL